MTNAVAGLGLAPDAAMVTFPIDLFLPGSDISPVEARKQEFYDGLTRWRPALASDGSGEAPLIRVEGASVEDAFARANHLMLANRWGDGLPLWPPTRERVDWILRGTAKLRRHRVGIFPPRGGVTTIETCAIALAMAGGRPEYLPVLVAAVDAFLDAESGSAQLQAASEKQAAQRAKLQEYVAKNSARASTAKQAQSRQKALAKMQPIAAAMEDPTLSFVFPSPPELRPPLVTLDMASVGYDETPILKRLNLRIDPDDRIALLGRNGNGKTTLARLIAAQLAPMEGEMNSSNKMKVGYFTQYQVEELDTRDTPLEHMTRQMKGATPGAVRAQLGRFGFSGDRAIQKVGSLSGGERARLALALITRDAPNMLILDEPTNHLDVDSREALVQALNEYDGAVVVVSHDRHMIELVADRLVLVDGGTATEYSGTLDDYTDLVLRKGGETAGGSGGDAPKADRKADRKAAAEAREKSKVLRIAVHDAEKAMEKLTAERSRIDRAMFDPASAGPQEKDVTMGELMRRRGEVEKKLVAAEARWMEATEALETGLAA